MAARFWRVVAPRVVRVFASEGAVALCRRLAMVDPLPSFPKTRRLQEASEFRAVFESGCRSSGAFFRLHYLSVAPSRLARLGLAISKKAAPLSVTRNRIKRLCREQFRQHQGLPAGDYVFVAQQKAANVDNSALRLEIERLLSDVVRLTAA